MTVLLVKKILEGPKQRLCDDRDRDWRDTYARHRIPRVNGHYTKLRESLSSSILKLRLLRL